MRSTTATATTASINQRRGHPLENPARDPQSHPARPTSHHPASLRRGNRGRQRPPPDRRHRSALVAEIRLGRAPEQPRHPPKGTRPHPADPRANHQFPNTPTLFGGDFNSPASDVVHRQLARDFVDAFATAGTGWGDTFQRRFPILRIDHIYATRHFTPVRCRAVTTRHSDHRMVVADFPHEIGTPGA